MKTLFSTTAILAAMTTASAVNAQGMSGNWYASVFSGYSTTSDLSYDVSDLFVGYYDEVTFNIKLESGTTFGVAFGAEISPSLRAELELSYAEYEAGELVAEYSPGDPGSYSYGDLGGSANATYILGNIWYNLADIGGGAVKPYIGGGLGGVTIDSNDSDGNTTASGSTFSYQMGAGALIPIGAGAIDVGYRFKGSGQFELENRVFDPVTSNNLQIGYRINFWDTCIPGCTTTGNA
ncbi:MAG: outer membrane protein [Yoonia sp.]|uniref:outer membrane protein n=1 Tax=Yoonia sp. TaxID=2212373 RepID=UPI003EF75259